MNDPPNIGRQYRLLYRGSLALPDSEIVLDGITFVAEISPSSLSRLLDCPIALALESMRGRPSLRFISIVKTSDVSYECLGDVHMYIHPRSVIGRRFFEDILCVEKLNENNLTQHAVRLGLGDGHGADDSDILILGRLSPFQSTLKLSVGRLIPQPTSTGKRKPRPDDPAPRRIPPTFMPTKKPSLARKHHSQLSDVDAQSKTKIDKSHGKQKALMFNEPCTSRIAVGDNIKSRLKQKRPSSKMGAPIEDPSQDMHTSVAPVGEPPDIETTNKAIVKRLTVNALSQRGMSKDHLEFRDLFNHTIHSVGFALRGDIKTRQIDSEEISRLVDLHVGVYLGGFGWLKEFVKQ